MNGFCLKGDLAKSAPKNGCFCENGAFWVCYMALSVPFGFLRAKVSRCFWRNHLFFKKNKVALVLRLWLLFWMDKTAQACMAIGKAKARILDKFPAGSEPMGVLGLRDIQETNRGCAIASLKMATIFAAAGVVSPVKKEAKWADILLPDWCWAFCCSILSCWPELPF